MSQIAKTLKVTQPDNQLCSLTWFLMFTYSHQISIHLLYLKSEKKIKQNKPNELECSKTPTQMSSFTFKHVFLYSNKQTHCFILINKKIILFEFFVNKSLKNHSAKDICHRTLCRAQNKSELLNLSTLSTSLVASIGQWRSTTFS